MACFRALILFLAGLCFAAEAYAQQPPAPNAAPGLAPAQPGPALGNPEPSISIPITRRPRVTNNPATYNYPPPPAYLAAPQQFFRPYIPTTNPPSATPKPGNITTLTNAIKPQQMARRVSSTNIVFDANMKEAIVKPGDLTADFEFSLTNVGPSEVTIHSVRASCGCTTPKVPTLPWKLQPGESGSFSVAADLRGKSGMFQKSVILDTTDGVKLLYVKVNIPAGTTMAGVDARARNMQLAQADRQVVFRGDCASCHVQPALGKTGEALFTAACGICHEAEHRATMVPDLHALKQKPNAAYWEAWVRNGKVGSLMPAFAQEHGGPLTEEQIASLVAYLDKDFPNRKPPVHTHADEDGGPVHPK